MKNLSNSYYFSVLLLLRLLRYAVPKIYNIFTRLSRSFITFVTIFSV